MRLREICRPGVAPYRETEGPGLALAVHAAGRAVRARKLPGRRVSARSVNGKPVTPVLDALARPASRLASPIRTTATPCSPGITSSRAAWRDFAATARSSTTSRRRGTRRPTFPGRTSPSAARRGVWASTGRRWPTMRGRTRTSATARSPPPAAWPCPSTCCSDRVAAFLKIPRPQIGRCSST